MSRGGGYNYGLCSDIKADLKQSHSRLGKLAQLNIYCFNGPRESAVPT